MSLSKSSSTILSLRCAILCWVHEWSSGWNRFWYTPADPTILAAIRVATGCLLVWSNAVWLMDVEGFFASRGWLPAIDTWLMNDQPWQWSWYFAAHTLEMQYSLAIFSLVASVCLLLGLATPIASVISLLGLISTVNRAPLCVFGLDDVLGMISLSLAIGPCGAVWSLDRILLDRWFPNRRSLTPLGARASVRANVAVRLLQVHLCVLYGFAGTGKLLGGSWWEGTAIWGSVANSQYRTLDLTWLASHPLIVNAITLTALFWEVSYAALIWPRLTRPLVLIMAIFVHIGIGLAMGMLEFGLAMLAANIAFLLPLAASAQNPADPI